jgi:hypothetical protein
MEVIVVGDGPQPNARSIVEAIGWEGMKYIEGPATGSSGNAQRMVGIDAAAGAYLVFIDDDDVHTRGAFAQIRRAVAENPQRVLIFQMRREGQLYWGIGHPELWEGNVSTQCFVVPNLPGKVGSWLTRDRYASDFDFISECVALQGEPVWCPGVIALSPPESPFMNAYRYSRRRLRPVRRFARGATRQLHGR